MTNSRHGHRSGQRWKGAGALPAVLAGCLLACGTAQAASVTQNRNVRSEISLAQAYWHVEDPALVAPCPIRVSEGTMSAALGNAGVIAPASSVWAETVDGSCDIAISSDMWRAVNRGDTYDTYNTCITFAHEYGHALGLPDEAEPAMMNANWTRASRVDPLCGLYTYGWSKISRASRNWLTINGLAHRHERAVAV